MLLYGTETFLQPRANEYMPIGPAPFGKPFLRINASRTPQ
jgi:hypothetical protein